MTMGIRIYPGKLKPENDTQIPMINATAKKSERDMYSVIRSDFRKDFIPVYCGAYLR